ncbi:helix-turn-helix domain-containing protein [Rhodococcus sp. NPDC058521]|uniref:helix-turn-helix domain-containing protein n=1 Tax=Rhodococcus sp. NPDC058521 TaxID=3346536 RepID=UPI003657A5CA
MATWDENTTARIGEAVKAARSARGWSAKALADRTAQLGHAVGRATISELETGRRRNIAVAELLILGAALEVPPLQLLYPDLPEGRVDVWPGREVTSHEAVEWVAGKHDPKYLDDQVGWVWRRPGDGPLAETWTWLAARDVVDAARRGAEEAAERLAEEQEIASKSGSPQWGDETAEAKLSYEVAGSLLAEAQQVLHDVEARLKRATGDA